MTAAHTALLVQLFAVLETVPDLTIRRGDVPPDEFGSLDFGRRIITIARDVPFVQFVATLMHETRHLRRGPCYVTEEEQEEAMVVEETVRLLVPASHMPAILERANPHQLAQELGIDVDTAARAVQLAIQDRRHHLTTGVA